MPDIGLDWPDLDAAPLPVREEGDPVAGADVPVLSQAELDGLDELDEQDGREEDETLLTAIDPAEPLRYSILLEGLGTAGNGLLRERFNGLSALRHGEAERANIAQIRRRGRTDATLLDELLRSRGYYSSRTRIDFRSGGRSDTVQVVLIANPGQNYGLNEINLDGIDPDDAALRALFPLQVGDPAETDTINAATEALRTGLLERGYPFAQVIDPVLVVQHESGKATLNLEAETGSQRRIGDVRINADAPFDADHIQIISRFSPGDLYRQSDMTDLDRALVATGLISQVAIAPVPGAAEDLVDIDINVTPAPLRTIAGELGYGTGEGMRAEVSWQHRNLFPPEGALTLRAVLGEQEQSLTTTFRRNNFGRRDRVLNGAISYSDLDQPAYQARTAGVSASIERQTNIIFQKAWIWSLGGEFLLSRERDLFAIGDDGVSRPTRERTYTIAALPTSVNYDGSDDLFDPRTGFRLGGRLSPEISLQGGAFAYLRTQVDASFYLQASDRVTVAGRGRLGTIFGAPRDRIAPTRRFYAGGGASVRGYSYQAIGPRDASNKPIGGRSLGEVGLELRFRFGTVDQFGLVPFIDAGMISAEPWPSFNEMRIGAGLGFRYYSSFGPIRLDVGTPINPQSGDPPIGVYVSLGQAF